MSATFIRMMYCALCSCVTPGVALLCGSCEGELTEVSVPRVIEYSRAGRAIAVLSLSRYQGPIAALIVKAKVGGDVRALRRLELMLRVDVVKDWCGEAEDVIAAPSSLWSRLRGSIDIAAVIGHSTARVFRLQERHAPRGLFWRLKKRAMLSRTVRHVEASETMMDHGCENLPSDRRVLLVDDVLTKIGRAHV